MVAGEYCGAVHLYDAPVDISDMSELCAAGVFRILFQLFFIPISTVGNVFIIATITMLKQHLNSPHDRILFAIAVVDLFIGSVVGFLHLLESIPETSFLIDSSTAQCIIFYSVHLCTDLVVFDLLTLMCVNRGLLVWKPVWHKDHIIRQTATKAIFGILAFRGVHFAVAAPYSAVVFDAKDFMHGCVGFHFPSPLYEITLSIFLAETVLSLGICIAVVVITNRRQKLTRRHSMKGGRDNFTKANRQINAIRVNAILISSLMFLFLLFWLPGTVVWGLNFDVPTYVLDLTRLIRWVYSGINAPLYVITRKLYRLSFKFLLTTPPWKWSGLRTSLKSREDSWITKPSDLVSRDEPEIEQDDDNMESPPGTPPLMLPSRVLLKQNEHKHPSFFKELNQIILGKTKEDNAGQIFTHSSRLHCCIVANAEYDSEIYQYPNPSKTCKVKFKLPRVKPKAKQVKSKETFVSSEAAQEQVPGNTGKEQFSKPTVTSNSSETAKEQTPGKTGKSWLSKKTGRKQPPAPIGKEEPPKTKGKGILDQPSSSTIDTEQSSLRKPTGFASILSFSSFQ